MQNVMRPASLAPAHILHVHAFMREFGGSYAGTHQLLNGGVLTNPKDRQALASMVSAVLEQIDLMPRDPSAGSTTGQRQHEPFEPLKFVFSASKVLCRRPS